LPASGCITADPIPPSTISPASTQIDGESVANESATTTASTALGMNYQRPCLSVYAPKSGCTTELIRYQMNPIAP
jgi:hypothetical protein